MYKRRHEGWRFVGHVTILFRYIAAGTKAATQRCHQLGMGNQACGLDLLLHLLLLIQLVL